MVYRDDECVVVVGERQTLLVDFNVHLLEIHNVESLVILLDCGPDDDLLLFGVSI